MNTNQPNNDGGPAFPSYTSTIPLPTPPDWSRFQSGMTLRDYKNRAEKAEAENARLREALELLLYVRGTSEDTPEVADQARAALAQSEKTKT